ncbi:MAG: hypothetical protein J3R72DRAFT_224678 [Linnemannia gamsii]|nr:MAG: hypothetical protein J3R72DRAFT_260765 [Linnemannia gamsii]KAK3846661.1 MAG: hypothetical protein J3R72DRAFT_224678 [Linnemannia gamsii]
MVNTHISTSTTPSIPPTHMAQQPEHIANEDKAQAPPAHVAQQPEQLANEDKAQAPTSSVQAVREGSFNERDEVKKLNLETIGLARMAVSLPLITTGGRSTRSISNLSEDCVNALTEIARLGKRAHDREEPTLLADNSIFPSTEPTFKKRRIEETQDCNPSEASDREVFEFDERRLRELEAERLLIEARNDQLRLVVLSNIINLHLSFINTKQQQTESQTKTTKEALSKRSKSTSKHPFSTPPLRRSVRIATKRK